MLLKLTNAGKAPRVVTTAKGKQVRFEPGESKTLDMESPAWALGLEVEHATTEGNSEEGKPLNRMTKAELQDYLTAAGITFETDANKPALLKQAQDHQAAQQG